MLLVVYADIAESGVVVIDGLGVLVVQFSDQLRILEFVVVCVTHFLTVGIIRYDYKHQMIHFGSLFGDLGGRPPLRMLHLWESRYWWPS